MSTVVECLTVPNVGVVGSPPGGRRTGLLGETGAQDGPPQPRLLDPVRAHRVSVWTMWSVLVLFLGPAYHVDPAGKFC